MDWGAVVGWSALIPLLNAGIRLALPTGLRRWARLCANEPASST